MLLKRFFKTSALIAAVVGTLGLVSLTANAEGNTTDTATEEASVSETTEITGSWQPGANGPWYLYSDGTNPSNTWEEIDGAWYYFNENGNALTGGWKLVGTKWYFFDANGKTAEPGWLNDEGTWYWIDEDFSMHTGWLEKDSVYYFFNESGAMVADTWYESPYSQKWYYFYAGGELAAPGWLNDAGTWYYLDEDSAMTTGWQEVDGSWYLLGDSGDMQYGGWVSYYGWWYYFNDAGVMQTGEVVDGGVTYYIPADGAVEDVTLQKAQNYSSSTNYLILVNRTTHYVHIYSGYQGNWSEVKNFQCVDGNATPNGTFTVGVKVPSFGDEKGYTCWYATQITGDILFHSILYSVQSKTSIVDGRMGIRASHGCIRLYIENALWIYNNIPAGTKVVIYE